VATSRLQAAIVATRPALPNDPCPQRSRLLGRKSRTDRPQGEELAGFACENSALAESRLGTGRSASRPDILSQPL
jgi:hypothetical protein